MSETDWLTNEREERGKKRPPRTKACANELETQRKREEEEAEEEEEEEEEEGEGEGGGEEEGKGEEQKERQKVRQGTTTKESHTEWASNERRKRGARELRESLSVVE